MKEWVDDLRWRALMAATQAGDRAAYDCLLRELIPIIRSWVRAHFADRSDDYVEDVVQDVLLSVHAGRQTYDPGRPLLPWITAIARHRATDAARRRRRKGAREVALDAVRDAELTASTSHFEAIGSDAASVRRAVAALPESQRRAVELLKYQGMSVSEASIATGMNASTLRVAVHRAVKALRSALERSGDQPFTRTN